MGLFEALERWLTDPADEALMDVGKVEALHGQVKQIISERDELRDQLTRTRDELAELRSQYTFLQQQLAKAQDQDKALRAAKGVWDVLSRMERQSAVLHKELKDTVKRVKSDLGNAYDLQDPGSRDPVFSKIFGKG